MAVIDIVERIPVVLYIYAVAVHLFEQGGVLVGQQAYEGLHSALTCVGYDSVDRRAEVALGQRECVAREPAVGIITLEIAVVGKGDADVIMLAPKISIGRRQVAAYTAAVFYEAVYTRLVAEDRRSEFKHQTLPL